MSKNMTPAQVAAKIGKFKAKQEITLKRYPVGPMANSARINLNKAEAALASLQEANEGMRVGQQPQAQMGASMPNDMNYMQAKYGGFTMPKLADGGNTVDFSATGEPASNALITPQLQDMIAVLVNSYGWTPQNALLGASVAYKESRGVSKKEKSYAGTSNEAIRKIFGSRVPGSIENPTEEDEKTLNELKADPDVFFEHVYGFKSSKAKSLGNNEEGDGIKFRGRGLIQLTGKNNYDIASRDIFGDDSLVTNPDLLLDPETAGLVAAWYVGEKASKGVEDFDVHTDIPADEIQDFLKGVYSTVSSSGHGSSQSYRDDFGYDSDGNWDPDSSYAGGMERMTSFINQSAPDLVWEPEHPIGDNDVEIRDNDVEEISSISVDEINNSNNVSNTRDLAIGNSNQGDPVQSNSFVPPPQALYDQIKEDGENATIYGNNPSILASANGVPEAAAMVTDDLYGENRGYLGNTYGAESTDPNVSNRITPEQAEKDANAQKLLAEFNALSPDEQSTTRVNAYMDVNSPDFTHEEVMRWGRDNYGVSEGRANSRNESGIDNMIIGANVYAKDKGHVIYDSEPDAGYGISVDATRILLQSLVNNGLSKEQALEALKDPAIYKNIKSNASRTKMGRRSIEDLKETVIKSDEWARTTSNREQLHSFLIPEGPREDGEDIEGDFATELAPGVNAEVSAYDARVKEDKEWWLRTGAGRYLPSWMYTDGAGGKMDDVDTTPWYIGAGRGEQVGAIARGINQDRINNPNDFNIEPSFTEGEIGQTTVLENDVIPEIVEDKEKDKEDKKKDKEKGTEEKKQWNPDTKTWETKGPDTYNLDMGNPSALMAIPGLAALASGRMQGRALENMQGPPRPITTMMPQFNYKSNIGQQLQEVKDAGNAVMQNTNLQGQQMAGVNQQVMAQRLKSNSGLLQQDAQQEQAARAQYDAMSTQVRMTNDALRNSYLQDSTNFKNKKEMLQTQARQQPLNVLASSAQDYLTNVYKSNLAAQMEAVGRPYNTGFDAEGNPIT